MSDTYKVRIGIAAARELEIEVDDTKAVGDAFERAVKKGEPVLWLSDVRERSFGIAVGSIAFVEFDRSDVRGVGFGAT